MAWSNDYRLLKSPSGSAASCEKASEGGTTSKPASRWSQKVDTTELSEELGGADRGQRPPGVLHRFPRLESWGIQNRDREPLTSGLASSWKAAEQDFETP